MPRQVRPRRVRVVRYYAPDGRRCTKATPGAVGKSELSETFYAKLGGKKVSLKTADEGQAWQELRRLLRDRAERRAGLRDSYTEAAAVPLAEHAEVMLSVVVAKGAGRKRAALVRGCLARLCEAAGWESPADLTEDSCLLALARLRESRGFGPRTYNEYLKHARQLSRWLARSGRLRRDPLENLSPVPADVDVRHARRCPSAEEIGLLMAHLHGPVMPRRRLAPGPQRALGYRLCMATGFRAGELRSLRRDNFDLDAGSVTVSGAFSKNKRTDVQPLPPWLITELREWFAAGGGTWERFPEHNPGPDVLGRDLKASGVAWSLPSPEGPQFFDFHSLRHFYLTWAANQPGISPKTLQALARHSSPALTLKIYAKARQGDLRAAVDAMPDPRLVAPPVAPGGESAGGALNARESVDGAPDRPTTPAAPPADSPQPRTEQGPERAGKGKKGRPRPTR